MFVKICGITNEDDALLAVAMGADAVGFVFAPSTRQISPLQVYDITRRLPPHVLTVGVFRDELPERVLEIVSKANLKAAQLHGRETPEMVRQVQRGTQLVIKAFNVTASGLGKIADYGVDLVLVDAASPGSGEVFDWTMIDDVPEGIRVILAGGLTPDNVAAAIKTVHPWGVDVSSGVERSPGRKDPIKLKQFIANARAAAPKPYLGPDELPYNWADDDY
jgi:phosphoribosylanthranilate isomerase